MVRLFGEAHHAVSRRMCGAWAVGRGGRASLRETRRRDVKRRWSKERESAVMGIHRHIHLHASKRHKCFCACACMPVWPHTGRLC